MMGKTHEALERAAQNYGSIIDKTSLQVDDRTIKEDFDEAGWELIGEGYGDIKLKVLTQFKQESSGVIGVTAPSAGSGSTTIACNLAIALALDGQKKVLLVDANLKNPCLDRHFSLPERVGLSNLLDDDNRELRIMKADRFPNLFLLPAGDGPKKSLANYDTQRIGQLIELLQHEFDFVIIDTPCVHGNSDAKIIGTFCDGVLLIVESGKCRKQVALRAEKDLEAGGARVFGVILNRRKHYIPEWLYSRL